MVWSLVSCFYGLCLLQSKGAHGRLCCPDVWASCELTSLGSQLFAFFSLWEQIIFLQHGPLVNRCWGQRGFRFVLWRKSSVWCFQSGPQYMMKRIGVGLAHYLTIRFHSCCIGAAGAAAQESQISKKHSDSFSLADWVCFRNLTRPIFIIFQRTMIFYKVGWDIYRAVESYIALLSRRCSETELWFYASSQRQQHLKHAPCSDHSFLLHPCVFECWIHHTDIQYMYTSNIIQYNEHILLSCWCDSNCIHIHARWLRQRILCCQGPAFSKPFRAFWASVRALWSTPGHHAAAGYGWIGAHPSVRSYAQKEINANLQWLAQTRILSKIFFWSIYIIYRL